MKRYLLVIVALAGLLALGPASAGAVLINFDDLTAGTNIDGMHLGPAAPDGCVITSASGVTMVVALPTDYQVGFRSYPNAVTNLGPPAPFITPGNHMTITFDVPRGHVAVTGGDRGGDTDQFTVDAYDVANNLIGSITTLEFGGNSLSPDIMVDFYRVTFDNAVNFSGYIKYIVIRDAINLGIGIDDLEYCKPIPVPGNLLLFAPGLLGLLGWRRFRKT